MGDTLAHFLPGVVPPKEIFSGVRPGGATKSGAKGTPAHPEESLFLK
jgi:hypothetical protein